MIIVIRSFQPDALGRNRYLSSKRFHARPHRRCMMAQAAEIKEVRRLMSTCTACFAVLLFGEGCPQIEVPARAAGNKSPPHHRSEFEAQRLSLDNNHLPPPSPHPQPIDCLARPSTSRAEAAFDHPSQTQINPFPLGALTCSYCPVRAAFKTMSWQGE